jgi:hypothetical protein
MSQPKHSPAEIAFLKAEIPARIRSGSTLRMAREQLGRLSSFTIHVWLANDPGFRKAYKAAVAERGEVRGRPPTPAIDIAFMKRELPRLVGEEFLVVRDALKKLGISYSLMRNWAREDPEFDQRMKHAVEDLTEHECDRLKEMHGEIPDAKLAKVASDNLKTWLELRNPKMRPRAPLEESNHQLADILRAAVNRLIDRTVPAQQLEAINVEAKRVTFRGDGPQETHRP